MIRKIVHIPGTSGILKPGNQLRNHHKYKLQFWYKFSSTYQCGLAPDCIPRSLKKSIHNIDPIKVFDVRVMNDKAVHISGRPLKNVSMPRSSTMPATN